MVYSIKAESVLSTSRVDSRKSAHARRPCGASCGAARRGGDFGPALFRDKSTVLQPRTFSESPVVAIIGFNQLA
jgi:hypothetical protein